MSAPSNRSLAEISVAARIAIKSAFEACPSGQPTRLTIQHAKAAGILILWSDLCVNLQQDRHDVFELQGELEQLICQLNRIAWSGMAI